MKPEQPRPNPKMLAFLRHQGHHFTRLLLNSKKLLLYI